MVVFLKDACNILMQSFFPILPDKRSPIFYRKNKMNMNLSITICHVSQNMQYSKNTNRSYGTKKAEIFFYQPSVPTEQEW